METSNVLLIPLTKEETDAVEKIKELIQKDNLIYDSNIINNNYLIRFLRARKLNIDKAFIMFKEYIKWREDFDIKNISNFEFPEESHVLTYYPQGLHKNDKEGRPIFYELLGKLDLNELLKKTDYERLFRFNIKNFEYYLSHAFPYSAKAYGKNISQFFSIIDLKGFNTKLLSKKVYDYIRMNTSSLQNYYPEILGMSTVINVSLMFRACWTIIKAFLDEKTKSKVHLLGGDYKKTLTNYIDEDNLPDFLGGKCKCTEQGCLFSNAGPWKDGGEIKISIPLDKLTIEEDNNNKGENVLEDDVNTNESNEVDS